MVDKRKKDLFFAVIAALMAAFTALTFLRNGFWQDEITLWDNNVLKAPARSKAYVNLAAAWLGIGAEEIALEHLRKAKTLSPVWNTAFLFTGDIYFGHNMLKEAEAEYRGSLALYPYDTGALLRLARISLKKGDNAAAVETLEKALRLDKGFGDARLFLGVAYGNIGRHSEAITEVEKALEISRISPMYVHSAATVYFSAGRFMEAERLAREFLQAFPSQVKRYNVRLLLARVCFFQGKYAEAVAAYKEHIENNPGDVTAILELGAAYKKLEQFDKAESEFKRALLVEPGNKIAKSELKTLGRGK